MAYLYDFRAQVVQLNLVYFFGPVTFIGQIDLGKLDWISSNSYGDATWSTSSSIVLRFYPNI